MRQRSGLGLILAATIATPAIAQSRAEVVSRYVWEMDDAGFGGFSALEVSENGEYFYALSDRTWLARGKIERDEAGRITAMISEPLTTLRHRDGGALPARLGDSEGLALAPDGALFVSFEAVARVWRYATPDGPAERLRRHPAFREMLDNASLEALAIAPDGALWTLPERSGQLTRPFPVFVYRDGEWTQPMSLPREDEFLPVGADFGPHGALYLLERRVGPFGGFASRIRRFRPQSDSLGAGEILWESPLWRHDNLEGIAVWQGADGIRMTLIADDNFNFFQTTEVLELAITGE